MGSSAYCTIVPQLYSQFLLKLLVLVCAVWGQHARLFIFSYQVPTVLTEDFFEDALIEIRSDSEDSRMGDHAVGLPHGLTSSPTDTISPTIEPPRSRADSRDTDLEFAGAGLSPVPDSVRSPKRISKSCERSGGGVGSPGRVRPDDHASPKFPSLAQLGGSPPASSQAADGDNIMNVQAAMRLQPLVCVPRPGLAALLHG